MNRSSTAKALGATVVALAITGSGVAGASAADTRAASVTREVHVVKPSLVVTPQRVKLRQHVKVSAANLKPNSVLHLTATYSESTVVHTVQAYGVLINGRVVTRTRIVSSTKVTQHTSNTLSDRADSRGAITDYVVPVQRIGKQTLHITGIGVASATVITVV